MEQLQTYNEAAAAVKQKTVKEPLFRIVKRADLERWKSWLIRLGAGLIALLVSGIVSTILTKGNFFTFFGELFNGSFGTERRIWNLLQGTAVLLCISLAITPAFKMRFWNIGAEGQVLIGSLAAAASIVWWGGKVPDGVLLLIMAVFSILAGAVWAVIPAIFKALWNTNETLFTLMMNYVATHLVLYCINIWSPNGSGTIGVLEHGTFPVIGGQTYLLNVIIVAVLTAAVYLYLCFSKHGYEISVVGESEKTAKYVGINVKKVIIRTLAVSGMICGLAGLLLVAGTNTPTINSTLVGGRGFTAILVSWLSKFNPLIMIGTSFLVVFLQKGAAQMATVSQVHASAAYSDIIIGIFFFFIIGCEFFINYSVKFRSFKKETADKETKFTGSEAEVAAENDATVAEVPVLSVNASVEDEATAEEKTETTVATEEDAVEKTVKTKKGAVKKKTVALEATETVLSAEDVAIENGAASAEEEEVSVKKGTAAKSVSAKKRKSKTQKEDE